MDVSTTLPPDSTERDMLQATLHALGDRKGPRVQNRQVAEGNDAPDCNHRSPEKRHTRRAYSLHEVTHLLL